MSELIPRRATARPLTIPMHAPVVTAASPQTERGSPVEAMSLADTTEDSPTIAPTDRSNCPATNGMIAASA